MYVPLRSTRSARPLTTAFRTASANLTLVTSPKPSPRSPRTLPPVIDLLRGHPRTALLPTSEIFGAASITLHTPAFLPEDSYAQSRHPLHYGPDLGNLSIRAELGRWVAQRYELLDAVEPEKICLTNGASYALGEVLRQCTSPITGYTRRAFLVSPTYFLATRVFEDAGFADKMTAISSSPGTIDFAALEAHLVRLDATSPEVSLADGLRPFLRHGTPESSKRIYRYVLYCVPTYSNPTGETMSLSTRQQLIQLARKHDILIVTDDVYDFLGNIGDNSAEGDDGRLLPRLVTLDAKDCDPAGAGNTVSNCSFSKLLGPGLRCGWVESATGVLAKIIGEGGANHSGGAPGHFTSTIIQPLLLPHSPRQPHRKIDLVIRRLREAYTINCEAARGAIRSHLPPGTEIFGGKGGFFMWLRFPEDVDARAVVKAAREMGAIVASGDASECTGGSENWCDWGKRCIRISVSYLDEETLVEGIKRLGKAVEKWREEPVEGEVAMEVDESPANANGV